MLIEARPWLKSAPAVILTLMVREIYRCLLKSLSQVINQELYLPRQ